MTAEESRKETEKVIKSISDEELMEIGSLINVAVKEGKFYIYFHEKINEITKNRLERLGYKIKITNDQREGSYTTIGW